MSLGSDRSTGNLPSRRRGAALSGAERRWAAHRGPSRQVTSPSRPGRAARLRAAAAWTWAPAVASRRPGPAGPRRAPPKAQGRLDAFIGDLSAQTVGRGRGRLHETARQPLQRRGKDPQTQRDQNRNGSETRTGHETRSKLGPKTGRAPKRSSSWNGVRLRNVWDV